MDAQSWLRIPHQSEHQARWLVAIASQLRGYRPTPLVLRHQVSLQTDGYEASVEVRRRSSEAYLVVATYPQQRQLLLDSQGRLWWNAFQNRRWVRQDCEKQIFDEVFALQACQHAQADQLRAVLAKLLEQRGAHFWSDWNSLSECNRQLLVSVEHTRETLEKALSCSQTAVSALPLLLDPEKAHPANRRALLEAGERGLLAFPGEVLPWLLLQVEWNLSPGLLGLVQASLRKYPASAWKLISHPNESLRRRLAQSLPAGQDWLSWLSCESQESVRAAILRRLEEEFSVSQLLDQLLSERRPTYRRALAWSLWRSHRNLPSAKERRWVEQHLEGSLAVATRRWR